MSREPRAEDFPGECVICPFSRSSIESTTAGELFRLACHYGLGETATAGREIFDRAIARPDWCPKVDDGFEDDETRRIVFTAPETPEEDLSDREALALILTALFGVNALDDIEDGGYIVFGKGATTGILDQIDQRLTRIEGRLRLAPIAFWLGDEEAEGGGGTGGEGSKE